MYNWRGVWNKALSDFWCNVKFSLSFTTEYKKSLKAFLQAPLQLFAGGWTGANKKSFVLVHQHGGHDVTWKPPIDKFFPENLLHFKAIEH